MLARLLPQGDHSLITRELARMGHQAPSRALPAPTQSCTWKLCGMSPDAATALLAWLRQQDWRYWWHDVPGAEPTSVDLLWGGPGTALEALRQERAAALQPVIQVLDDAWRLQAGGPSCLRLGDRSLALHERAYVMGILNVTPDSFSDGGLYVHPAQALKHADAMLDAGADLIDVGGQSSRPDSMPVPPEVERQRVLPVIRALVQGYGALVSVDTYRASVAAAALDAGAVLVNDISAMQFDAQMGPLIARRRAAVVLMHMQGTPQTMQRAPTYRQVGDEVYRFLADRLQCAQHYGIERQRILLDPGFGFGKTVQHNVDLLRDLAHLRALGQPLLVGTSRKSFLGRLLNRPVRDRLEGSLTTALYAVLHGAQMVRVHDVAPMVQSLRLLGALEQPSAVDQL